MNVQLGERPGVPPFPWPLPFAAFSTDPIPSFPILPHPSARDLPAICLRSALARMAFPCEPGVALNTWQARVVETLTRYNIEREARHLHMAIEDVSKGKPLPAAITPW